MLAKFEEKEFEHAFNNQLGIIDYNSWCPGQFLEATVGFDGAALINDPIILQLFGPWHSLRQQGVALDPTVVRNVFGIMDAHILPPTSFRFNLFVQHKRPEYMEGNNAEEWQDWMKPYFRYKIQNEQQIVLTKIEQHLGQSALVLYSCPAFYTKDDLWVHIQNRTIIRNTNFTEPSKLKGHHAYTFDAPGANGRAFSEKKDIHGKTFEELVAERTKSSSPNRISKLILSAGQAIKKVFEEVSSAENQNDFILFSNIVKKLSEKKEDIDDRTVAELIDALSHIIALRFVFGTSLTFMGADRSIK